MSLPFLLQGLGSVGIFASRAFLPAFATALALRFGPELGGIGHLGLLARVKGVPTWFTSDACLIVLGILSALEMLADRSPEIRDLLKEWAHSLKALMAALTFLGVLRSSDRALVDPLLQQAGLLDALPAALVGALTFAASTARASVVELLTPEGDDGLGLGRVGRWTEEAWSLLGPWLLIALPILTLLLVGLGAAAAAWLGRRAKRRELASLVACARCGQAIHASALDCPSCHQAVDRPMQVGWLGFATTRPVTDREIHSYRLLAAGRCPTCSGYLGRRAACEDCGRTPLAEPAFAGHYLAFLDRRVLPTALTCLAFGLIPVVGAIGGVLICRVATVGPIARYLPMGRGLATRWTVRVASIGLIAFQWVPLLGALTLPAVVLINHAAYRRTLVSLTQVPDDPK